MNDIARYQKNVITVQRNNLVERKSRRFPPVLQKLVKNKLESPYEKRKIKILNDNLITNNGNDALK